MFNLSNLIAALQYGPVISKAAQEIQASNPDIPGATKKQLLLAALGAAAKVGETVPEAHVALISVLVDEIVTLLKGAGVFGKPAIPAATPPAQGSMGAGITAPFTMPVGSIAGITPPGSVTFTIAQPPPSTI